MRTPGAKIRLGISSCLLGQKVRYDGDHRLDRYLAGTLGRYFEWVPVCPEVAIGLGVPRPPIRLVGRPSAPRAVGVEDASMDVTGKLAACGRQQARRLDDICGYVFKSRSPSCGLERVKVYQRTGAPAKHGRGIYADAFLAGRPWLPAEEEDRLGDPRRRENFIERVFVYHRWRRLTARGLTAARLAEFHARHQLALMAHDVAACRRLERLVARAGRRNLKATAREYLEQLMQAFRRPATRPRHARVLRHLAGCLRKNLDAADRAELLAAIHAYRHHELPLAAPLTLLRHHFRRHPDPSIAGQTYLNPDPRERWLRGGT